MEKTIAKIDLDERIKPWGPNPRYWQYKKNPVLLLGGSKEDNLFQIPDLKLHLDEMVACGANVIRNTMSDRDPGDLRAWAMGDNGLYDLDKWNDEYWHRFSEMLRLTSERDIIVQIEVWDRFDFSRDHWLTHPLRPGNNVNYDETIGLEKEYPSHPSSDKQPFFHTIPGLPLFTKRLEKLRTFQESYVKKMLSYSLQHGNVLYCMSNETNSSVQWGQYWIQFIRNEARLAGVDVYCTDMFDDIFRGPESVFFPVYLEQSEFYDFCDISQVNSRIFGKKHWDTCKWLVENAHKIPRPVNHTKIYSDGNTKYGSGTPQTGLERFWHNILLGSASSRFHRPGAGIGLNDLARFCIRSARMVESRVKFWDLKPLEIPVNADGENNVYCAAIPGKTLVVFFCQGDEIELPLNGMKNSSFSVFWIPVNPGDSAMEQSFKPSDDKIQLHPPSAKPWVAVIE